MVGEVCRRDPRAMADTASTSTQNRKWKSLLLLLVTLSDGETPGGDAWPRRIDSRGPSGLERRASEAAGMAGSRRAQTRGAGDNGSGFVVAVASLRRRSLIVHRAGAAVFDAAQRCRMLCRHPSPKKRHCFDGVCTGVRIRSGSLVGPRRALIPSASARADQLSMRRAAQPTMRGSLGSCWRGERDAHSLACQILTASDIRLAPTRVKRTR